MRNGTDNNVNVVNARRQLQIEINNVNRAYKRMLLVNNLLAMKKSPTDAPQSMYPRLSSQTKRHNKQGTGKVFYYYYFFWKILCKAF